jgi:hypothetical protein
MARRDLFGCLHRADEQQETKGRQVCRLMAINTPNQIGKCPSRINVGVTSGNFGEFPRNQKKNPRKKMKNMLKISAPVASAPGILPELQQRVRPASR